MLTDVFAVEWMNTGDVHMGHTIAYYGFMSDGKHLPYLLVSIMNQPLSVQSSRRSVTIRKNYN
jgi:hypothetical protein